jgi:hypothetical protein
MGPESGYIQCPFGMTDGCARVIELTGTQAMKSEILPKLCRCAARSLFRPPSDTFSPFHVSRDPKHAWTAGQWMTERPGRPLPSAPAMSPLT